MPLPRAMKSSKWNLTKSSTSGMRLSLAFYAWWDPRYVILIVVSAVVDFRVGQRIHESESDAARKRWVTLSLCVNLGLLAVFKYTPFLVDNAAGLGRLFLAEADIVRYHQNYIGWSGGDDGIVA